MSQPEIPHLTPASLFTDQAKLDAIRLTVYNRILAAVHQKIRAHSSMPNSTQMTNFDVPEWQPGCPRYDVKDCILYMVWTLRHAGFKVLYVSPNRLLISWKEQSIRYYQEESPIRQAMVAAAKPDTKQESKSESKSDTKKPSNYKPIPEGIAGLLTSGASARGSTTITFI
jgi:hypothetical protein